MNELPIVDSGSIVPEQAVRQRYAAAAQAVQPALCCAVSYDASLLEVIPPEVIERDYGCGDPTAYVRPGETVLDLGSGGGKVCFIAAQLVGPQGRVIGVDCNAEMLALARRNQPIVAERLGYDNVAFRAGMIQDLRLDLDRLAEQLTRSPVSDRESWLAMRDLERSLRRKQPLVPDSSVDCVVSNCVLNLVDPADRRAMFDEVFRVLRPGGRAAISDIVADEDVPPHLQNNPELWSGCISGAFREDRFLAAFAEAGFDGLQIERLDPQPWQVVEGIEFRSMTVLAYKPAVGENLDRRQAVIYRGPFREVTDDAGRSYRRGERTAVGDLTFARLGQAPFAGHFEQVEPQGESSQPPQPFDGRQLRDPRETKGAIVRSNSNGSCCGD